MEAEGKMQGLEYRLPFILPARFSAEATIRGTAGTPGEHGIQGLPEQRDFVVHRGGGRRGVGLPAAHALVVFLLRCRFAAQGDNAAVGGLGGERYVIEQEERDVPAGAAFQAKRGLHRTVTPRADRQIFARPAPQGALGEGVGGDGAVFDRLHEAGSDARFTAQMASWDFLGVSMPDASTASGPGRGPACCNSASRSWFSPTGQPV